MSRAHFICDLVDGHYDPEGTQLRAMDLFPSEHYKIDLVVVQLAMCQYYKPCRRLCSASFRKKTSGFLGLRHLSGLRSRRIFFRKIPDLDRRS